MNVLGKLKFSGEDIVITDPMYFVKTEKHGDITKAPKRSDYYPPKWDFSTEIQFDSPLFETTIKCEAAYRDAYDKWNDTNPDDWDICNYGDNMELLGFKNYLTQSTIYGPWSCTVYNINKLGKPVNKIGNFTSDSGMVGVFTLSEINQYNSAYNSYATEKWSNTVIHDFDGIVTIINVGSSNVKDCDIRIIGCGNVSFMTRQTGW